MAGRTTLYALAGAVLCGIVLPVLLMIGLAMAVPLLDRRCNGPATPAGA